MPTPYDEARIQARRILGRLTVEEARTIKAALDRFIARITSQVGSLSPGSAQGLVQLQRIVTREAELLARNIEIAVASGRSFAFKEILRIWEEAGIEYARSRGLTGSDLASIRTPPITLLSAFETLSPVGTWKSLLKIYTREAAQEVMTIVRNSLIEQADPQELAQRLRRYVSGSEPFQKAFAEVPTLTGDVFKLDLRTIPARERGAARSMVFNAERIAFSELHNARAEAEVTHMVNDPYVKAVRWTLSPNRGSGDRPDECDILAKEDLYGMGPGVFPVANVPAPPHPFDRCEKLPVTRATAEIDQPKPMPGLQVDPLRVSGYSRSAKESASQAINNAALAGQR